MMEKRQGGLGLGLKAGRLPMSSAWSINTGIINHVSGSSFGEYEQMLMVPAIYVTFTLVTMELLKPSRRPSSVIEMMEFIPRHIIGNHDTFSRLLI
jgi:hypothetical protein